MHLLVCFILLKIEFITRFTRAMNGHHIMGYNTSNYLIGLLLSCYRNTYRVDQSHNRRGDQRCFASILIN